jgi:hypothetical protein
MRLRAIVAVTASAVFAVAFVDLSGARGFQEDGLFGHLAKAGDVVLAAVDKWNKKIDDLTNSVERSQLRLRLYRLHKNMDRLIKRKEELLESVKERRPLTYLDDDIMDVKKAVSDVRDSLVDLGAQLSAQDPDGQKFQQEMELDLNDKMKALIDIGLHQGTAETQDKYAKRVEGSLERAIKKLSEARAVVGECQQKLK